jgi:RNA polymerase sigma-70 factor (ECF subfamily)
MGMPANNDVKALFTAVANGDTVAFKLLFEQYRAKLYAVAFKWTKSTYAAEEITQDIFVSLWTSRAQLQNVLDPEAYLYTAAYNKISKHLKKESNKARILALAQWAHNTRTNETEETVYANDSSKHINNAVEQLSPQKKLIYKLSRQHGKSYDEIAETLHLSPNTVKSQLVKAVKSIRGYLEKGVLFLAFLMAWMR